MSADEILDALRAQGDDVPAAALDALLEALSPEEGVAGRIVAAVVDLSLEERARLALAFEEILDVLEQIDGIEVDA